MGFTANFTQSVIVLVGLILLGTFLRRKGLLKSELSPLFARIVTDITLPALIFSALAVQKISFAQMEQPLVMAAAEVVCILVAWGVADLLKLDKPSKGAFILVAAFGSSAFLGYPVIRGAFPGNSAAMSDAVIVSELGVGVLIFTVGVMIAMFFGRESVNLKEGFGVLVGFLHSPVFVALVSGIVVSIAFPYKSSKFFSVLMEFTRTLGAANTVFVTLTIGIMLKFEDMRPVLLLAALVCFIKLILKPVLVALPADIMGFPEMWKQVTVIEAAMPSATLAAVFSSRYGCDGELAAKLLMLTLVCSVVTMVGVVAILL
ncbi:MAG: AEC family transporter [Candidatus Omnitrophota bacterium]|nr:AEC family transporter [Candidatus Omnitrophota bacterium]